MSSKNILGYHNAGGCNKKFLKIHVRDGRWIRHLRDCFHEDFGVVITSEEGVCVQLKPGMTTQTFNSTVEATLQFMVDVDMMGCAWCRLPPPHHDNDADKKMTTCDIEHHGLGIEDLCFFEPDDDIIVAPLRLLSFDIEAAGRRGVFPQASEDPVIQIALHFKVLGGETTPPTKPILLSYKSCDAVEGADVMCFENEADLLRKFAELVVSFDCDVFTGFNVCNFDFLYLRDRAVALQCEEHFEVMTRFLPPFRGSRMSLRETVYESVQAGKRKRVRVTIAGRVCLDMYTCIQNNQSYKLEKYTLNAVSAYFLNDQKVDLPFTQITPMWEKDSAARRELGIYCLKDAQLPLDLMDKLDSLTQTMEMARCAGIPLDWVLQRGILIRNTSLLLRRAKVRGYVFPSLPQNKDDDGAGFQGATVLDAVCGIHHNVGVLDFSSMYPSIIRGHNLCYSTILLNPPPLGLAYEDMNGKRFVQADVVKGVLPEIVEHLQTCRNRAKAAYAAATEPMQKRTSKARELAFKVYVYAILFTIEKLNLKSRDFGTQVCGNGMYGALGSSQSLLPLMVIAETVTFVGRRDIMTAKAVAERTFPDCRVKYGDTDSIFIQFPVSAEAAKISIPDSVAETMEKAKVVAKAVNEVMKPPKSIAFEKVYSVMLLLSKKRYAGLMYSENHKWGTEPPTVDVKGMQSVRRDGCALMRDLVRDCLTSILHSGDIVDAAATVRKRLLDVVQDKIPLESYAVSKTLRKSMQDCSLPMSEQELREIREQLGPAANKASGQPLSFEEQVQCIQKKIKLVWKSRVKLPHVCLAWKLMQIDLGTAPVLGESISYVVIHNGGKQIADKVESLERVAKNPALVVDRPYYLESLKVPLENIFKPVFLQRLLESQKKDKANKEDEMRACKMVKDTLWACIAGMPLTQEAKKRKAAVEASPIAMLFKRQMERS